MGNATLEKFSLGVYSPALYLYYPTEKYLIVSVLYPYYKVIEMPKKRSGGRVERTTVNVPKPLYEAIREIVEDKKTIQGYVSVDDFIRDTLRRRLEELKPLGR